MDYFVSTRKGSDNNSGKASRHAFQTIERALQSVQSGDTLRLMQGETFAPLPPTVKEAPAPFSFRMNNVSVKPFNTGRTSDAAPVLTWAVNDPKEKRGIITVYGSDNTFEGIDTKGALKHVVIMPGDDKGVIYSGNVLHDMTMIDWALAIVDYASHTTMTEIHLINGRMLRNEGKASDVGASAITLWREAGYEHVGTRADRCSCVDGYASKQEGGFDSSLFEIFGGIADVDITRCYARNTVFMEVGGTTSRHETASNVLIQRCEVKDPFGKILFVNKPTGDYHVDWTGFHFDRNIFQADDEQGVTPFYFDGDHGDMSKRLRMTGNTIVSRSTIYNGGKGTNLETITRSANTYWRSDNGTNVGVTLINGDCFQNPMIE